ncbi:flagellar basal body rod protein FlgB [Halopseudomonas sp.]|jgi:flagellar basal-body rod protein FlgB|uniref:flagellar basal body rod protein FlgB n=1 Tax=Halopseudomonas sp. TaxID=2901191 RepID=UPI001A510495|nr:flagellar basal body rod protein FlgB [Pseudomonas sp.]|tara:strand:- start:75335 stop:75739 length:405 start_codon:yes stop_codon:yes gene_type:complete
MTINFDNALGIHEKALAFRGQRAAVLANNIANAETPNYKARDLEFSAVLAAQQSGSQKGFAASTTHSRHISAESLVDQAAGLRFRTPLQPALDGNTVDADVEQSEFAKNAIELQASFTFLNSRFKGLMTALRGE